MLTKLEQAKANNKTIKVSYTTILFSGSSGVGKTSLVKKLNKKPLNRDHHSTGVAESKHTICMKTSAVIKSTDGLQWIDLDYDSMISYLNKHLHNLKFPHLSSHIAFSAEDNAPNTTRSEGATNKVNFQVDISSADFVAVDIAKADSSNTPSLGDIWDVINFLDTGGQPEFINILPAVSSSVSLTFIVFNLRESLDDLVYVQHNVRGESSFKPYYLDCTNAEFIKRLMISSENFNKIIAPLELKCIQRQDVKNDSKICYVGTHAINVREEKIKEIDDQLSSMATELELQQTSCWCSPKPQLKRLFPIDMFPTDEDKESFEDIVKDIRDNIQKQVQRQDYYEVPITWFLFLLKIQKLCSEEKVSYIAYQKAVDVWMDKNVSKNELQSSDQGLHDKSISRDNSDVHNILLFFHFMGMLLYYHEVKGISDFVFIDRQWLFQKLTELVEIKFTKGYNKKDVNAEDFEKFTIEGRLSINIIKNLNVDLQGIDPLYFIYLLDYLNIVAPIDSKGKEYFMPSVLPTFPIEKATHKISDLEKFYGAIQHVPLLVGLKNGPMPHGIFCHFIVKLFRNLPTGWILPLLSTQGMQHIYNNLIMFPTTSGYAVSLLYKIGYLEIQVRSKKIQPSFIYCDVQHKLVTALQEASGHLKLNKEQLCYGFYCSCKDKHFAKLKDLALSTECVFCKYGYVELTEDHKVWLQV